MNPKQKLIITAAQEVFAEIGFKKVILDDVAQKLNMTRTALYYYYKNKEELFRAVLDYELERYSFDLGKITGEKGNTLLRLSLFCSHYVQLKKNFINMYKLTSLDIHSNFEIFKSFKIAIEKLHTDIIENILKDDREIPVSTDVLQGSRILSQAIRGLAIISDSSNFDTILDEMSFLCSVFYCGLKSYNNQKEQ